MPKDEEKMMNRLQILACAIGIALTTMPAGAEPVVLENADARVSGDKMQDAKALAELELDAGADALDIGVTNLASPFAEIGGQEVVLTGRFLALGIDVDADEATGTALSFARDVAGIDWQVDIAYCGLEKADGDTPAAHCVNGFWARNLAGGIVRAIVTNATDGDAPEQLVDVAIQAGEKQSRVSIPYADIGAVPGTTIRVHVLGWKGPQIQALFEPQTLVLGN
jgi:hypothetical protein